MATRYSGQLVLDGLIFAVDASTTRSYVSGSTTWENIAGSDGLVFNGTPLFDSGSKQFIHFNEGGPSASQFASSSVNIIPATGSVTVCAWINLSRADGRGGVFERKPTGVFNGYSLGQGGATSWTWTVSGTSDYNNRLNFDFNWPGTNVWKYWVGTYDGNNTVHGYEDGISAGSPVTGVSQGNLDTQGTRDFLKIGSRSIGGNDLPCKVGSVHIYNRVLSAEEVLQNYNATKGRFL